MTHQTLNRYFRTKGVIKRILGQIHPYRLRSGFRCITRVNSPHARCSLNEFVLFFGRYLSNFESILLMDLSELIFRFPVTYDYVHDQRVMSAAMNERRMQIAIGRKQLKMRCGI